MRLLLTIILAGSVVADAATLAFTKNHCLTLLGTTRLSSVPSYTTVISKTDTVTTKSTSLKTITVIPSIVSKSVTTVVTRVTTITAPGNTKTISSTTTLYTTAVSTVVETGTSTVTTTETSTSVDTTTVGTASGYIPLQSQIASLGYIPSKRDLEGSRPIAARGADAAARAISPSSYLVPGLYPAKVKCTQTIHIVTTSTLVQTGAKTATTTLKQSTVSLVSTSYVTSTVTTYKTGASTTVTSTSISTISSTTTSTSYAYYTSSETTTVVGPSATSYAFCNDPNNYLHQVNGTSAKLYAQERDPPYAYDHELKDEVSCCNGCAALGPRCAVAVSLGPIGCYYIGQDAALNTCDPVSPAGYFQTGTDKERGNTAIFNTNCGRWRYDVAGSDPI